MIDVEHNSYVPIHNPWHPSQGRGIAIVETNFVREIGMYDQVSTSHNFFGKVCIPKKTPDKEAKASAHLPTGSRTPPWKLLYFPVQYEPMAPKYSVLKLFLKVSPKWPKSI